MAFTPTYGIHLALQLESVVSSAFSRNTLSAFTQIPSFCLRSNVLRLGNNCPAKSSLASVATSVRQMIHTNHTQRWSPITSIQVHRHGRFIERTIPSYTRIGFNSLVGSQLTSHITLNFRSGAERDSLVTNGGIRVPVGR